MTAIPDEVVREAWEAMADGEAHDDDDAMRRALAVAVKWAREDQKETDAKLAKSKWLTADCGTIGDADYGNELCLEIEAAIRNQKD